VIEGIRYKHLISNYPRFLPWSEVEEIAVYEEEGAPYYLLSIIRKHMESRIDLLRTSNLIMVEAAFETLILQIHAGRTILEVP